MHERAVQYFRRALRLNPAYLSAWTLMGHEYVELKNPPAAIGAREHAPYPPAACLPACLRRGAADQLPALLPCRTLAVGR